ncbi:MAG: MerP protein [Crocinitomicaceae bacterium]|nr:MerP protein [Crocinitomicaceae bacterium]|tara:strand:+ start:2940 stop:3290 length:351 start_codon:yes stop_codon:yes gene_type:complete
MNNKVKPVLIVIFMMICILSNNANAQKSNTIEFHTSAQCGMCKERIEGAMNYERGIQFVELNMDNMFLTVKYKTKVHTEASVKKIVAQLGYSAGEIKANEKAMNELPKCCQPGAHL